METLTGEISSDKQQRGDAGFGGREVASASVRSLPDTLQSFLENVGVLHSAAYSSAADVGLLPTSSSKPSSTMNRDSTVDSTYFNPSSDGTNESIFESYFDLTTERLQYVFHMFDTDQDGKISYESLKQGLQLHTGGLEDNELDDQSFQHLINHLDLDHSGDITFPEFAEGIRLLMLRSLLRQSTSPSSSSLPIQQFAHVEVFDYSAVRFENRVLVQTAASYHNLSASNEYMLSAADFYFQTRPEWVQTRWVNVVPDTRRSTTTGSSVILTMNRLAVAFLLHPLALEDALSADTHRPKAELYSNHYFIMCPVFFLEWGARKERRGSYSSRSNELFRRLLTLPWKSRDYNSSRKDGGRTLKRIGSQMVSIFVKIPDNDTIITFTSGYWPEKAVATTSVQDSSHHLWDRVKQELKKSYSKLRQYDAQYLTYALLDEAVDLLTPILSAVRGEIIVERERLEGEHFRDLSRIQHLQNELEKMGRKLKPFLRLLTHVIEDDAISPGATVYLRDVFDNLECSDEELRQLIHDCESLVAEADKVRSRQMDQTLYTLTVVSTVFLPAQFLTGVWGMNFVHMPELDEKWGYKMFWAASSFLVISLVLILNCGRLRR